MTVTHSPSYPLRARGFIVVTSVLLLFSPVLLGFIAIAPVITAAAALDHAPRKAPWIVVILLGGIAVTASLAAATFVGVALLGVLLSITG